MACVAFTLHIHIQQNLRPESFGSKMKPSEKKMEFFWVVEHLRQSSSKSIENEVQHSMKNEKGPNIPLYYKE
ncbi:hypothetical protein P3S67_008612 [Capsicum chacoense]